MSLLRKLAGQTIIYGFGHILGRILYFLIIASYLSYKFADTKSYGVYTEMYAYASLLIVIFSYRLDTAFFRFGNQKKDLESAYSSSLIPVIFTTICFVAIGLSFSDGIARLLHYGEHISYIRWFIWIIAFDVILLLPYARLRLEDRPKLFVIYRLLNIFLSIFFILFFLQWVPWLIDRGFSFFEYFTWFDEQVDYVFFSNLLVSGLMFLIMLPMLLKAKFSLVNKSLYKKMVWYAFPLIVVGVANSINQFFAVPLQKFLMADSIEKNISNAGIYAAPQRIAMLISIVTTAFNYAAEPFFFKQANKEERTDIYGEVAKAFVIVIGLVILILLFYFDLFKHLVDVSRYAEGFVIVPILLFAYLFLGLYYNVSIWYKLADKTIYGAYISILGALLTLGISVYFLPKIGFIASAWAALSCYGFMVFLAYCLGRRFYPIRYPVGRILFYVLFIFGLYQTSDWFVQWTSLSPFILLINTLLLMIYFAVVWILDGQWLKSSFAR